MQMKLLDKKKHLDNLNLLIKQQDQTARSLALLTHDVPTGYGKMSHQTIYDILKGKTEIKYWQLQEFARILGVRINKIISDDIVKCEIIQYFDRDKFHYVPRAFDQPLEVIYFLNNAYLKPTYKAFYHNAKGYYKSANFSLIDTDHANWCHDKDKRERFLMDTQCMLQCDKNGLFYLGQILKFNKDGTCDFQWWKRQFICNADEKFTNDKGIKSSYNGMIINEYELVKHSTYKTVFPQISNLTLFDEDYKIEQISI